MLKRKIKKYIDQITSKNQMTYAQCGEDIIIKFLFDSLLIHRGTYMDIGANDPIKYNNTYLLYKNGWHGVNIDPQAEAINKFNKLRKRDKNLQIGVGATTGDFKFYSFEPGTLSTFDFEVAQNYILAGHKLLHERKISLMTVSDILKKYCLESEIDLLTLDIEGGELAVLQQFFNAKILPKVIVCETLSYNPDIKKTKKNWGLIKEVTSAGYLVFADTYINTIFSRENLLKVEEIT